MRNAQGLPVNMIVLTALALLVLVVVGAFFISGFGQATGSINIVEATQADCQNLCQSLATSAYNYDDCGEYNTATTFTGFRGTTTAVNYVCSCNQFGACTVTLRGGDSCVISQEAYSGTTDLTVDYTTTVGLCQEYVESPTT